MGFIAAAAVGDHHPLVVYWHHLLDFLVAVPGPYLIDRDLISIESHQVGVLPVHPPASIISVNRRRFPYRTAQLLVGNAYLASGAAQGILGDGPLSQLQPSQSLQHPWHFPHWNPELVVEGMGSGHDPLAYPGSSGSILVRGQIRGFSSSFGACPKEKVPEPGWRPGRLGLLTLVPLEKGAACRFFSRVRRSPSTCRDSMVAVALAS